MQQAYDGAMKYAVLAIGLLAACQTDETVSGFVADTGEFTLQSIDGTPFAARATLNVAEKGKISGQAPCNRYFGAQTAPYPWFAVDGIASTKMGCADLTAEDVFLRALSDMTIVEVSGPTLILSNDAGREMVFQAP